MIVSLGLDVLKIVGGGLTLLVVEVILGDWLGTRLLADEQGRRSKKEVRNDVFSSAFLWAVSSVFLARALQQFGGSGWLLEGQENWHVTRTGVSLVSWIADMYYLHLWNFCGHYLVEALEQHNFQGVCSWVMEAYHQRSVDFDKCSAKLRQRIFFMSLLLCMLSASIVDAVSESPWGGTPVLMLLTHGTVEALMRAPPALLFLLPSRLLYLQTLLYSELLSCMLASVLAAARLIAVCALSWRFLSFMSFFPASVACLCDLVRVWRLCKRAREVRVYVRTLKLLPRASKQEIDRFDSDCVICLDSLHERPAVRLPCRHVLHQDCVLRMTQSTQRCPVCRAPTNQSATSDADPSGDEIRRLIAASDANRQGNLQRGFWERVLVWAQREDNSRQTQIDRGRGR